MTAILLFVSSASQAQDAAFKERFEKQVQEYEAGDRKNPPPRDAILFAGDSQFFRWKTIHEDRGIDSCGSSSCTSPAAGGPDRLFEHHARTGPLG